MTTTLDSWLDYWVGHRPDPVALEYEQEQSPSEH